MTALHLHATVDDGPFKGRRLAVRWTQPDLRGHSHIAATVEIADRMVPVSIALTVLAHHERTGDACTCLNGPRGRPCYVHGIGVPHTERTGT